MVIWITGLSGSGKTSLANEVLAMLKVTHPGSVLIDGDAVRAVVDDKSIGYDRTGRLVNAYRISRMAKMLSDQGLTVIVATMSLFKEIHRWNRENIKQYCEVYLNSNLEELKRRDARNLYSRAKDGITSNVAGIDQEFDAPSDPNFVFESFSDTPQKMAQNLIQKLECSRA